MGAARLDGQAARFGGTALVAAAAVVLALLAERASNLPGHPVDAAADALVGLAWVAAGSALWLHGHGRVVAALSAAVGVAWLMGGPLPDLVFLHRGPLVHLLLSHPSGRVRSRATGGVIAVAYLDGAWSALGAEPVATMALCVAVVLVAATRSRASPAAAFAAAAFAGVLVVGAALRLTDAGGETIVLSVYEAVLVLAAAALTMAALAARESAVTAMVVDLGGAGPATLREVLAAATLDAGLAITYPLADGTGYVDDLGRPVTPPAAVTDIRDSDRTVALLSTTTADGALLASAAAGLRIALANARLDADVRAQAAAVVASRRRLVAATVRQRRLVAQRLQADVDAELERAAALIDNRELAVRLYEIRRQLGRLAAGLGPAGLDEGLPAAVGRLVDGCGLDVTVICPSETFGTAVETTAWFVCSEALANVAKHAGVAQAHVAIRVEDGALCVRVEDEGTGGADPAGAGLLGLRDRVAAANGRLTVDSRLGRGTVVAATLPVNA